MRRKKKKERKDDVIIPSKIKEIISYLSYTFSRNKLFERDDLRQDLYLHYIETLRLRKESKKWLPGLWFLRFKQVLLTKHAKEVKRINRLHDIAREIYNIPNTIDLPYFHSKKEKNVRRFRKTKRKAAS